MLEAKAMNTGASVLQKKRSSKSFFRRSPKKRSSKLCCGEKDLKKFFFRRSPIEKNKKRLSQIFRQVSGALQQNFNGSKNTAVLEPRTGQFWTT